MNSKIKLPVGIDDFQRVMKDNYYFVDKSLFIRDVIDDAAQVILLPRPRRFGKTLNLSMLYYYFSSANAEQYRHLFEHLAIMQAGTAYASNQGKYPVIFFTLKDIKEATYAQAYGSIEFLIANLYRKHTYLLESEHLDAEQKQIFTQIKSRTASEVDVANSLQDLIKYLHHHHGIKPILLLDEYDTPIHTAYECDYYDAMVRLMQVFLGGALKGNIHLYKAVITGILRVAQASIFSGLNNVVVSSILDEKFSTYFGFLDKEVEQMKATYDDVQVTMEQIREWYNGYQFGSARIYNPWSILNVFYYNKPLQPYWVNVANNSLIKKLVSQGKASTKSQFELLLQAQSIPKTIKQELIFPELMEKENALWSLLLFTGYLTLGSQEPIGYPFEALLRIPNKEVQCVFEEMVTDWFSTQALDEENYDELLQSLVRHDAARFARLLQAYIRESGSYFDFNQHTPEQVYHALVLGLVVGLRDQFYIQSNRESGDGRFDVCLFPKQADQIGILMEFKQTAEEDKLADVAATALTQINEKQYDTAFRQKGVGHVFCLGVAFAAREVKIASMMREL